MLKNMEQLVKFFRKYFPESYKNYPVKRETIKIIDEKKTLKIENNSINVIEIKVLGKGDLTLSLNGVKNSLIYLELKVMERANLTFNVYGVIDSEVYLGINSESYKESKLNIDEKLYIKGKMVNITNLYIPKGSINSLAFLDQKILLVDKGLFINLPIINVKEPKSKAEHSSKKVKLEDDHIFYLKSKALSEETIQKLLEKSFFTL